jgi:hypothetical protein
MEILNLAGAEYDLGNVLFAVLQECEHRRRAFEPEEARDKLMAAARAKLAEIHESYREAGGTPSYWEVVEREVLENSMPQYLLGALEQNRLERTSYGIWRGGDPLSRILFGLGGVGMGAALFALPVTPIPVDALSLVTLAGAGFLYPEVKRLFHDWQHNRLLNRLVAAAEAYQKDSRIHYVSNARLEEELRSLGGSAERQGARHGEASPASPASPDQTDGPRNAAKQGQTR